MVSISKKITALFLGIVFMGAFTVLVHAQDASVAQSPDTTDPSAQITADGAAQVAAAGVPTADDVNDQLNPADPGDYTSVTISLTSDLVDLSRADIEWTVNGKSKPGGIDARSLSVTTGAYGTTTTVVITITDNTGEVVNKTITITPNDLTVLWEATDSYVPAFYPGKKLPSRGSIVRVAAIPNFSGAALSGDPATYVYTWTRNGDIVPSASGYGKDFFDFVQNPVLSDDSISVNASDVANTETATRDADVSFFDPHILFYGINTSTGLESPLASSPLELNTGSVAVDAQPYYFSARTGPELLNFAWTVDGTPITLATGSPKHLIVLKSSPTSQSSNVDLSVTNANNPFQTAENTLHVDFGQSQ